MTNSYYNGSTLTRHTLAQAETLTSAFSAVAAGFDKVPAPELLDENTATYAVDTGSADTYAIALQKTLTGYNEGLLVRVKFTNTNTGASTLNVDGLGARSIKLVNGTDPAAGDLTSGDIYDLVYKGTTFVLLAAPRSYLNNVVTSSSNVTITGGSVTGITDLAIADGGTGASTASGARTNLGLGTAATATVQTSWLDATTGRVLLANAFGWGHDAADGSSNAWTGQYLSDITVTGVYRYSSTNLDTPSTAGVVLHFNRIPSSASGGMMQMAISSTGTIYTRAQNGVSPTTFSAWETVLSEGSFGLGGAAVQLSGTDSLASRNLATGVYSYNGAFATDGPEGSVAWVRTVVVQLIPTALVGGGNVRRLWLDFRSSNTGAHRMWVGSNQNNDAIAWREVFHQGSLLGTVSQSGGVPTGAVIERGGNDNGAFVRFADGTQICWQSFTVSDLAVTTVRGALFTAGITSPVFPAAFVGTPAVTPRGGFATNVDGWLVMNGVPTASLVTNGALRVFSAVSLTETYRWSYVAIGRWF